jgi:hypothetical protein
VVRAKRERATLKQTGLRLEAEILDRLRSGDRGLSDEIRDRLERTFKEDALDASTRELRDALVNIAAKLRVDYYGREWHQMPQAHDAFVAAIIERLREYAPPPHESGPTGLVGASALFGLGEPPEIIGKIRERDDRREHSYPQLEAAQSRRSEGKRAALAQALRAKRGKTNE